MWYLMNSPAFKLNGSVWNDLLFKTHSYLYTVMFDSLLLLPCCPNNKQSSSLHTKVEPCVSHSLRTRSFNAKEVRLDTMMSIPTISLLFWVSVVPTNHKINVNLIRTRMLWMTKVSMREFIVPITCLVASKFLVMFSQTWATFVWIVLIAPSIFSIFFSLRETNRDQTPQECCDKTYRASPRHMKSIANVSRKGHTCKVWVLQCLFDIIKGLLCDVLFLVHCSWLEIQKMKW